MSLKLGRFMVAGGMGMLSVLAACSGGAGGSSNGASDTSDVTIANASSNANVTLTSYRADGSQMTLSGTLIAPDVVLTAGHGVAGFSQWKASAPGIAEAKGS